MESDEYEEWEGIIIDNDDNQCGGGELGVLRDFDEMMDETSVGEASLKDCSDSDEDNDGSETSDSRGSGSGSMRARDAEGSDSDTEDDDLIDEDEHNGNDKDEMDVDESHSVLSDESDDDFNSRNLKNPTILQVIVVYSCRVQPR